MGIVVLSNILNTLRRTHFDRVIDTLMKFSGGSLDFVIQSKFNSVPLFTHMSPTRIIMWEG